MSAEQLFREAHEALRAGDLAKAERRFRALIPVQPVWAQHNLGVVYAAGQGFNLYALDATKGTVLKTLTTGGPLGFSSPVVVNGMVYVGSFDKKLHAWGL